MALDARDRKIARRSWLLAGLGMGVFRFNLRASQDLAVTFDGDDLHVAAPGLHFLTGRPLERLQDGATVVFVSQLTLFSDDRGTVFRRVPERLVVSYDLWEEKFAVTIPGSPSGAAARSHSHMTAAQAEMWCMNNLAISALGLAPDRPFWLRFDLRAADRKDLSEILGDSGISLTGLIDIFSRKPGADGASWTRNVGPLRLRDLPRITSRRTRSW